MEARRPWFARFAPRGPHRLLVAESAGRVVGYASSHDLRPKPAYDCSVETTIYLDPEHQGRGVGRRLYGELRFDSFEFSDLGSAHFQTLRAGYLVHPRQPLLGGVTIGYRRARGDTAQSALEIGLPLALGTSRGWMRFTPTYVISSDGIRWNYSLLAEFPIVHTPLVVGFDCEARTLRQYGELFGTVALVLGTRF